MTKPTVFIDGEAGTTGLQIAGRLSARDDITVLSIDRALRKDAGERARLINAADAVILCLPDDAAREAVSLVTNPETVIIDASTAHRTAEGWVYGFAEHAPGQRRAIAASKRISNPGCYSTGAIALLAPLVRSGLIAADAPLTINAISGYSGGGNGLIAEFEGGAKDAYRPYAMTIQHKHVPEIVARCGLSHPPLFAPSVGAYAQGMIVEVPLQLWSLPTQPSADALRQTLSDAYAGETFVHVMDKADTLALQQQRKGAAGHVALLDPESLVGTNSMRLAVFGNDDTQQARLVAVLDNLGKGASGAAVQNLNIALGLDEGAGLQS
jgi:N-acetyl-gamma-glutamyl-phosphate reductase